MITITYLMRIFWNLVTLAIVIGIFSKLHGQFEVIVVSVLGFIYVAIKFVDLRNTNNFVEAGFVIDEHLLRIRTLLGDKTLEGREGRVEEAKRNARHATALRNIDIIFLVFVWCICLYQLITH